MNWITLWFTLNPPDTTALAWRVAFGLFAALFLVGIVVRIYASRATDRSRLPLLRRVAKLCVSMGALGLILGFFSFENIRLLGARFWYPIWLLGTVIWAAFLVKFAVKELPAMRAADLEKQEKEKYIPKPKGR